MRARTSSDGSENKQRAMTHQRFTVCCAASYSAQAASSAPAALLKSRQAFPNLPWAASMALVRPPRALLYSPTSNL